MLTIVTVVVIVIAHRGPGWNSAFLQGSRGRREGAKITARRASRGAMRER